MAWMPLPAYQMPANAMLNFQPVTDQLNAMVAQAYRERQQRLAENQDTRAAEMHPLQMDQTRAQTGLIGAQTTSSIDANSRANQLQPYQINNLQAQTGLTRAQTGQVGAQTQMTNLQVAGERENQAQRMASLFAMATTPEQHAALVNSLRSRGVQIPQQLSTFQGSQGAAATLAGPALTQAQTGIAQLNRLDPLREIEIRAQTAARYGLTQGMPGYAAYVLGGQVPTGAPLDNTSRTQILESDNAIQSGQNAVQSLNQALQLSAQAYSGMTAGTRGTITGNFGSQAGQATQQFSQLMTSQALEALKATFGAAPTEGERKILLEVQGAANQPQAVRDEIIRRAIQAAQQRIRFHTERANALRGGTYFVPGYNPNNAAPGGSVQSGAAGVSVQQPGQPGVQTTTADQINATRVGDVVTIGNRRFRRMPDGGFNPE